MERKSKEDLHHFFIYYFCAFNNFDFLRCIFDCSPDIYDLPICRSSIFRKKEFSFVNWLSRISLAEWIMTWFALVSLILIFMELTQRTGLELGWPGNNSVLKGFYRNEN